MNHLTDPQFIKDMFRHYQISPKQYMGQNFLIDDIALSQIITAANIQPKDHVVEVGPGLGVLTQEIAKRAGTVLAVEKDRTMLDILDVHLKGVKNVKVTNQDILRMDFSREVKGKYKVVANIPYYLTSHLFRYFLEQSHKPESMVFLVQKEVAERLVAKPGEMSVLAVSVQLDADAEFVAGVGRASFWPSPKVDSAIVRIKPHIKFPQVTDRKAFFRIVKVGFSAKRKQLHNNFTTGLAMDAVKVSNWLVANKIDPKARAQDLSLDQWVNLYRTLPE